MTILPSFNIATYKGTTIKQCVFESFYNKGWESLEKDTSLLLDDSNTSNAVVELLARMFNQEDIANLVYCSNDTGLGVDFHTIYHKIHEIKPSESKVVKGYDEVAYINKFSVNGVTIVQINTKDSAGADDSMFVILKDDMDKLGGENEKEENNPQAQTSQPTEEVNSK